MGSKSSHMQVLAEVDDEDARDGLGNVLLAESLLNALGARAEEVAPEMRAEDVANVLDAYVTLGKTPKNALLSALGARATHVVPDMKAAQLAKSLNAYSE